MKYFSPLSAAAVAAALAFSACAALPRGQADPALFDPPPPEAESAPPMAAPAGKPASAAPEYAPPSASKPALQETRLIFIFPEAVPEIPQLPENPEYPDSAERIMGTGTMSEEKLASFLMRFNARADDEFVRRLSGYYIEEAAVEGVNHDTAFAQMCLETGFLGYGGLVTPGMNNFCGLGATGPGQPGLVFPDARSGVRAHIQHLKAYASTEPLNQELIDPRFHYVRRGSSPTIHGLAGTWAADTYYNVKIARILDNLYKFEL